MEPTRTHRVLSGSNSADTRGRNMIRFDSEDMMFSFVFFTFGCG